MIWLWLKRKFIPGAQSRANHSLIIRGIGCAFGAVTPYAGPWHYDLCDCHNGHSFMALSIDNWHLVSYNHAVRLTTACSMMTSSNGNIFHVTGPFCREFTGHRWVFHTKASDAELGFFFDLRLNKRLSKHSWGWWPETPSHLLWRHCNEALRMNKHKNNDMNIYIWSIITDLLVFLRVPFLNDNAVNKSIIGRLCI